MKAYALTTHDGKTVDLLTHAALLECEKRLGYPLTIAQGSYHKGVSASAGTHDGGGVVDLAPWDWERKVRVLRAVGFAAWHRPAIKGLWPEHIHAVLIGNRKLAPVAARQVTAYRNHRDGLAGNRADNTWRPSPIPTFRMPKVLAVPDFAKPKPAPKPAPKPVIIPDAAILSATTVKTPSDHLALRARIKAGAAEFVAVTANIRATPPMRPVNVQRCVDLALGPDVSVVGFNEMGGRDLSALLATHPGWACVQGPKGDRRRAPIAYDTAVWSVFDSKVVQFSSAAVKTKLGTISVPSGNRWATVVTLRHKVTGVLVRFISYHSIAHMNVGAGFGWTGKGPRVLLALRSKIPNPAVTVYKQGMAALEAEIQAGRAAGCYVVPMGDWNYDALADLRDKTPEKYAPRETMRRAGVATIYSAGKLRRGTAGKRGIDYIGVAGPA